MLIAGILTILTGAFSFAADPLKWLLTKISTGLTQMITGFAHVFIGATAIGLKSIFLAGDAGATSPGAIIVWCAIGLAFIAGCVQAAKMAISGRGAPMAVAAGGLLRTILVIAAGPFIVLAATTLANQLAAAVVQGSLGSGTVTAFVQRLVLGGTATMGAFVLVVVELAMVLIVMVLLVELLARQVAILLLLFSLPLAAAGSMLDETSQWWARARSQLLTVIMVKPVIAIVFAVGFLVGGNPGATTLSGQIKDTLTAVMVLAVAAIAWPVLARYLSVWEGDRSPVAAAAVGGAVAAGMMAGRLGMGAATGGGSMAAGGVGGALEAANSRAVGGFGEAMPSEGGGEPGGPSGAPNASANEGVAGAGGGGAGGESSAASSAGGSAESGGGPGAGGDVGAPVGAGVPSGQPGGDGPGGAGGADAGPSVGGSASGARGGADGPSPQETAAEAAAQ
jgi:hypothetical protein